MVDIIPYGNFKDLGKTKKKKQIILCHTSREVGEYLTSLKFRNNGRYFKIPHYVIAQDGKIFKLLNDKSFTKFFGTPSIDKDSIFVSLENLGWLNKKPLSSAYLNWLGNIYKQEVYEKKWRDYSFWHPYTTEQFTSTVQLCKKLCEDLSIPKKFVGHNVKVDGVELFNGIATKSNYHHRYTDLSPAFSFENFKKEIEYEQLHQREI
jgi:N-acetyl-anhydromuramyl-L-alanine amidase AmpD